MVIPDLTALARPHYQTKPASAFDRFLAGTFDFILIVPIASFTPALHLRQARLDYLQGFDSSLLVQAAFIWILTYVAVLTLFLFITETTPGGLILNLRVRSLNGKLSWNQCLIRSVFSLLSWVFLFFPLIEVITHPMKRAWHDRVSDTVVIDLKSRPSISFLPFNTDPIRIFMVIGLFVWVATWLTVITSRDGLDFSGAKESKDSVDSVVAQTLLRKDLSEETLGQVEELIWSSQRRSEKSLSYFLKLQIEKDEQVKLALAEQICRWTPSESIGSLCSSARYLLKGDDEKDQEVVLLNEAKLSPISLTAKVFWMQEMTKRSRFDQALALYSEIKKSRNLSQTFEDSLRIWDVSLFWNLQHEKAVLQRLPAGQDSKESVSEDPEGSIRAEPNRSADEAQLALEKYIKERVSP